MPAIRRVLCVSAALFVLALLATSANGVEFSAPSFDESDVTHDSLVTHFEDNLAFKSPLTNFPGLSAPLSAHHANTLRGVSKKADIGPPTAKFLHGVASGDPLANAVIIWTRVTPVSGRAPVAVVQYQVATDASFKSIVKRGAVITSDDIGHSVKVDVQGLIPATTYYYRFMVHNEVSPVGRTKTLVGNTTDLASLNLAVVSCANMPHGYFHAYDAIAKRNDIDVVLGLGDYIYEYDVSGYPPVGGMLPATRDPVPAKVTSTITDYRMRYAQYKSDPQLQLLHAQKPWIVVWDDHEFADNAWIGGAVNQDDARDGPWSARKLAAMRAFHENIPIRPSHAHGDKYRVYRSFQIGNLVDLLMLDTRMDGRMQQDTGDRATRELMGAEQEQWLHSNLKSSKAKWRIIGNQMMIATLPEKINPALLPPGFPAAAAADLKSSDTWNGYPKPRKALLDVLYQNKINNTVMLTGDFHGSVASDIPADGSGIPKPNAPSVMTEFVGPSITSASPAQDSAILNEYAKPLVAMVNPSAKWVDLYRHGYMFVAVTPAKVRVEYNYVRSVKSLDGGATTAVAVLETASMANRITAVQS
ncbi:hypothetical protein AMAG_06127 [Allomyces macrogynus ATCC 38327]|uniref:PhoD-like phosphatase metallophosphatase domain-containing protein n=1 Tax=Allomyces macrogynus (strain ATCC 38327) TaxID=578462 RepID=A0A0L0SEB1_ALLM3|nr:hypothetical protein AMAG_06127 [Allomyces macrogynus ATCC 38327]|eukprot:KNE60769.1 hypothetical protein AMAG_06127 [Allomyces macrogynus ATCC 38327]